MITMFCCDNFIQFPSVPAEEEADQVTRDLLLVFAGPDALQRGFLKPEEAQGQGPQVAGVCRFQGWKLKERCGFPGSMSDKNQ